MPHKVEREIQLSRPLSSLAQELTLNVYRTDLHLTAVLEEVLRPADLRLDEFNVLRIIRGGGPEGHPRAEIEKRMVHAADRLLAILHKLKTRGLIEGTVRLSMTAEGQELLRSLDPAFQARIEERVGWIPEDRLRVAIEVLESIRGGPPAK